MSPVCGTGRARERRVSLSLNSKIKMLPVGLWIDRRLEQLVRPVGLRLVSGEAWENLVWIE